MYPRSYPAFLASQRRMEYPPPQHRHHSIKHIGNTYARRCPRLRIKNTRWTQPIPARQEPYPPQTAPHRNGTEIHNGVHTLHFPLHYYLQLSRSCLPKPDAYHRGRHPLLLPHTYRHQLFHCKERENHWRGMDKGNVGKTHNVCIAIA